jgi:hypothetical protein
MRIRVQCVCSSRAAPPGVEAPSSVELNAAIDAIAKSIFARPIASVADIIDRAILAAWSRQPDAGRLISEGDDLGGLKNTYIVDVH